MPPSALPGGHRPSSFCSVDWLSQSSCSGPRQGSSNKNPSQMDIQKDKLSELVVGQTPVAGLNKEPDTTRTPRVRTAFTTEQVSALESSFQQHQYLGPLERRKLAREMQLSEVQIKTWFQNRRMKHKRQMQDSQLNVPFSGPLCTSLHTPFSSPPGSSRQLPFPWAPLPGPQALMLPSGSFWGLCQVEQTPLASAWASGQGQPLTYQFPDPGSQVHTLGPALSGEPWGLCALPKIKGAF
ncbi:homeobox protein VENTX [Castor canadensis]|uniref:Homeobox protein VENTX n=1 Tax=Castor canadensis TaxID=51338 RepID=A0AC58MXI7_CASCN